MPESRFFQANVRLGSKYARKNKQLFNKQGDAGKRPFVLVELIYRNSYFAGCLGDSIRLR